ncbi:OLC1v1036458C1 [Oldenlandia corymbosa var. corymbosa]|uniref:OLC1v1036458C1 n=1 Tax=Oldenlandia corymbosa var. corymbosa TaxID=529605 RepID=A0AAV1CY00_OLDCO|nr:OLC1v1036458C1 [Oldenlandia corymbosa var. corymbosa]
MSEISGHYQNENCNGEMGSEQLPRMTPSKVKKQYGTQSSLSRAGSEVDEFITLLHGSDPVRIELNRLENELRDKERELGDAHAEIKALKYTERLKEKAVEELAENLKKAEEKLKATEAHVETKNLEIKKIDEDKKAAVAAQFAAESSLRRVHAAQKDDEIPPIEAIIAPLEAELKLARIEVIKLQDDNRALDRLTKSKEAALLEAERAVQVALAKASLVDELQNRNQDLMKQVEICQEENRILDKMHRQKVAEVEKLTQTIHELEEAVLVGGAAANAVRDYQRKVQEMNEEKRTVDRELARAKISANRVAVVVANDWKDANDKVMPVKQWLEERRIFQGEIQQLKDKLTIAERAAKAEAQLKEKFQLRFKVLEGRLRSSSQGGNKCDGTSQCHSLGGDNLSRPMANGISSKTARIQSKSYRTNGSSAILEKLNKSSSILNSRSRSLDGENIRTYENEFSNSDNEALNNQTLTASVCGGDNLNATDTIKLGNEDYVSGMLYDMLQKEVITLRKACQGKDHSLKEKDEAIEV